MTITEVLIPALRKKFTGKSFRTGSSPDPIAVFSPAYASIGELSIMDEGDEALVYIGNITHSHFNSYDEALNPEERVKAVSEMVVTFLDDLFKDQVVLWGSAEGRGGFFYRSNGSLPKDITKEEKLFVWSGPIQR